MAEIDLKDYSVIDVHCHPFGEATRIIDVEEFAGLVSFGDVLNAKNLLLYKQIIRELSQYLSSPPTPKAVVEVRNTRSMDYPRYLEELFSDVKLKGMIVDDGYSEITVEKAIPKIEIDEFKKFVPIDVYRVTRLEPLIKDCLDTSTNFTDLMNDFTTILEEAVKKKGAVGFKSVTAYRTGLNILKIQETEAKRDFKKYKEAHSDSLLDPHFDIKRLRDYLFYHTVMKCIDLDVPFQVHTGIGDVDIVAKACNPIGLFDFLKLEEVRRAKIVLTHSGYPYAQEAAWLTNVFPNVYLDLSIYTPFTFVNVARRVLDILEMAPMNKIFYASDAFKIPELHWVSVKLLKRALSKALEELIGFNTVDEDDAYTIAKSILSDNAEKLYGL
jgi:predicted TIM-barrel fold metal-dependent hydrolase